MKKYYLLTLLSVFSLKSSELNEQMKKDFYQSFPKNRLGNHGTIEFYPYANRISIVFNTPVEARTPEGYFEKKGEEYQSLYNDVQRRFPKIEIFAQAFWGTSMIPYKNHIEFKQGYRQE